MSFDWTFTKQDLARTLEFQARLTQDGVEYWSSDNFRNYGLDKHYDHPDKEVGALFAKYKAHGLAETVGEVPSEIPSNHKRKNDLWRWTEHGRQQEFLRKLTVEDLATFTAEP